MASTVGVALANGTLAEATTRIALQRLLDQYDLEPWIYTREIVVDETTIPHSHPVLTLNAGHARDDHLLLAEFIHEQLHWFEEERATHRDRAIEHTSSRYPSVPAAPPEGASDEYSTRLHLIVCHLEHQALKRLLGSPAAHAVMETLSRHHYRWVYRTVLDDEDELARIVRSFELLPRALAAELAHEA